MYIKDLIKYFYSKDKNIESTMNFFNSIRKINFDTYDEDDKYFVEVSFDIPNKKIKFQKFYYYKLTFRNN